VVVVSGGNGCADLGIPIRWRLICSSRWQSGGLVVQIVFFYTLRRGMQYIFCEWKTLNSMSHQL
jgi:hypothetical protein